MPRTGSRNPPGLTIEVDDLQATYLPGDNISGWITYSKPSVKDQPARCPNIVLTFFGRAKSKYMVKTSNGSSISRGRAVLFQNSYELTRNSTCTAPGDHSWPFNITIPTAPQPGFAQRGDEWKPHTDGYLATKDDQKQAIDVTRHPLPGIMYYFGKSEMSGKTSEAYVEYVLVATAADLKATFPIFLRRKGTELPIKNFKPQARSNLQLIRTPKLLTEHADTKLTFRQKSSRIFRPSKTPRYTFNVKVECPTVIQLEHPEPLALKIAVVPDLDPDRTTICPDGDLSSLPPVSLTSLKLKLKMQLDIRCPGTFWDSENDKHHDFDIPFIGILRPCTIPVISATDLKQLMSAPDQHERYGALVRRGQSTPYINAAVSGTQEPGAQPFSNTVVPNGDISLAPTTTTSPITPPKPPINLGVIYSIYIGSSASSTLQNRPISFKRQLYPSFTTYNIRLTYSLSYKFTITCAGKSEEVSGVIPVTVIPPSEEQEAKKKREMGTQGMKRNYDDLEAGIGAGIQFLGQVLQAVAG